MRPSEIGFQAFKGIYFPLKMKTDRSPASVSTNVNIDAVYYIWGTEYFIWTLLLYISHQFYNSTKWISAQLSQFCVQKSPGNILASVFWGCQGVIINEFLDNVGLLLNVERERVYAGLRKAVTILFLQVNDPAHNSLFTMQTVEITRTRRYSPDLTSMSFFTW